MLNIHMYDLLKERIIGGVLAPDQHLNIDGLARELGPAPFLVRETLTCLAGKQLIQLSRCTPAHVP